MRNILKPAAVLGLAAAMALSAATPAAAAPVLTNTTAVKAAVADDATQVRWRGHRRGHAWAPGAVVGGLAAGALIGGAIAASPYYHGGYYAHDPYYSYPYAGAYAYSPALTLPRAYYDRDCFSGYDSAGVPCY